MSKKGMGLIVIAFIFAYGMASITTSLPYGKIIFVDDDFTNDPSNHKWNTIQAGIDDAEDGDIIYVFDGNYEESLFINKEIKIIGNGNVVVDGGDDDSTIGVIADNVSIENLKVKNGQIGIFVNHNNFILKNCEVYECMHGLFLQGSNASIENCTFYTHEQNSAIINGENITFYNCSFHSSTNAVVFEGENISLKNCNFYDCEWGIIGEYSSHIEISNGSFYNIENKSIWIKYSDNVFIFYATFNDTFCGIWLMNVSNSSLAFSMFNLNKIGIKLQSSSMNEIRDCSFIGNIGYGIYAENSFNNTIHHNNFIDNGINAYDNGINKWNTSIGNYWNNYEGIDENEDGIGDIPYEIGINNDEKPLINPIEYPPKFVWVSDEFTSSTPGWNVDHFNNIQDAISAVAEKGSIYVYWGNYDGVEINKELNIIAEENTIISSDKDGLLINSDNVSIKNFLISAGENGIKIMNSCNVSIEGCNLTQSKFGLYAVNSINCSVSNSNFYENIKGIYLFNSSGFRIYRNSISNNSYFGIEISHHSSNNAIFDNNIEYNGNYGVYITHDCNKNKIYHNNFINNTAHDAGENDWSSSYEKVLGNYWDDYEGIDENEDGIGDIPYEIDEDSMDYYPLMNRIVEPPSFVWVNSAFNSSIPGWNADHFISIEEALRSLKEKGNCFVFPGIYKENVGINKSLSLRGADENLTFVDGDGMFAINVSADNVKIFNFGIKNSWNDAGVKIFANDTVVYGCSVYDCYYGFYIEGKNVTVEKCRVFGNSFAGIFMNSCENSSIKSCEIYWNNEGIISENSYSNAIEGNTIFNNSVNALRINKFDGNSVKNNLFMGNIYGIYAENSFNNSFYLNSFLNNGINAYDNGINKWNTSIGNYWDDYEGVDENEDGIGDTPYEIDEDSIDYLPLIRIAGYPVAYFNYTPSLPSTFEDVFFNDKSIDFDGYIVSYTWNFGDGSISHDENPVHQYTDDGTYYVNLTVVDNDGNTHSVQKEITVLNTPPFANFSFSPLQPSTNDIIQFNDLSYDFDGYIASYTWNFGDGSISHDKNPVHQYTDDGTYYVNLTVVDNDGNTHSVQKEITVLNTPPFANFSYSPSQPSTNDIIQFNDLSYDFDGYIASYTWNFGDGSISHDKNPVHQYTDDGTYYVNLTVVDNDGATSSIIKEITVKLPIQRIIFVDDDFTNDPSNHKWNTIQAGIDDAEDGDIIYVFDGEYTENIFVNKELTIIGESENVIIDGNGRTYAVNLLSHGIKMENITVKNALRAGIYVLQRDIEIKNCNIFEHGIYGIEIYSDNISIINCTIYDSPYGIMAGGRNIEIYNIEVYNVQWGIIFENSFECGIKGGKIYDVENKSIWIDSSENITVFNVDITNSFCGIWLTYAKNSSIFSCNITLNKVGLDIEESTSNEIRDCSLSGNIGYGIYAENSFNNTIHHNNFIDNGINAYDNGINKWNTSIGNYWDDYEGIDENEDGIGDIPYEIGINDDEKPLINPIEYPPKFVWVSDEFTSSTPGWNVDHFNNIQDAISAVAEKGSIYVCWGSYDGVEINKEVNIKGEGSVVEGIKIFSDNVSIENFVTNELTAINCKNLSIEGIVVSGSEIGVYVVNSYYSEFININSSNNEKGFYILDSHFNKFYNLLLENNTNCGMEIKISSGNEIRDCSLSGNIGYGIYAENSFNNTIHHNNFIDNGINAYDNGINKWNTSIGNYWDDYEGIDENEDGIGDIPYEIGINDDEKPLINPIEYPPKFVWVSDEFTSSTPGWNVDHFNNIQDAISAVAEKGSIYVYWGNYDGVEINKEVNIKGEGSVVEGIKIFSDNVSVKNLNLCNVYEGYALLAGGDNLYLKDCIISSSLYGLYVDGNNVSVENCYIEDNAVFGFMAENAENLSIKNSDIQRNNIGVILKDVNAYIYGVSVVNNTYIGMKIEGENENTFYKCYFAGNVYGVYCTGNGNTFYLNSFLNNGINAYDNGINKWNTSIGNYWDDYEGVDENEDGIGDTPYEIDEDSIDYLPLIRIAGYPVAYFNYTPSLPSTFEDVFFNDKSIDFDGYIVSYTWNFGDGSISHDENPVHQYTDDGTYYVNLTIVDDDGNTHSVQKEITVLNTPPFANFSFSPSQPTDTDDVVFNDTSYDIDGYITNYTWNFGDGSIAYGQNVSHIYEDNGTYNITLIIIDNDGATSSITKSILVKNVPPFANFSYSPEEANTSQNIQFNDLSYDLDGYITNYTWNFGDGSISHDENPVHQYTDDGTYYVNLTVVDNDGATSSIIKSIFIKNVPPFANFSFSPLQPTDMDDVVFNDTSYDLDGYITNYTWNFGDGSISHDENSVHQYTDDGTYYVNLTVVDNDGATSSITKSIFIKNVPPVANFVYTPDEPTDLDTIQFTSTSYDGDGNIVNYTWNFGDGNINYSANPAHKYPDNGVYMVTLIVKDDDGDVSEITKSILVKNVPPFANFSYSPLQPTDLQSITFKSNSYDLDGYILNYTWDFGDGNYTYGLNKTLYKYEDDGTYTVRLIVRDDDDETGEMSVIINVSNVAPTAIFTIKPTKPRQEEKVVFDASQSYDPDGYITNYSWDFDSNGIIDDYGVKAEYRYEKKGDYLATLTIKDDDGAEDSYQILVSVREKEKIPGFELIIIIIASAILISMKRYKRGIWRI